MVRSVPSGFLGGGNMLRSLTLSLTNTMLQQAHQMTAAISNLVVELRRRQSPPSLVSPAPFRTAAGHRPGADADGY